MFLHWTFSVLCIVTTSNLISADDKDLKLLLVQMLYRHGDRAPISLYPNDPNPESIWPEGLGSLTLLGKKQHYNLGKYFRNFYKDFKTSSPLEYLQTRSDCPRADVEELRVANTPEAKKFNAKHQEMYDYMEKHSAKPVNGWLPAAFLRDNIWVEMRYNLSIPDWVKPYWNELTEVKDLAFYWIFNSPLLQRLRVGPLLQLMIKTMEDKIEGRIPNLKFQIFSAHDTNIAAFLMSLNLFDLTQPPYCATVLVELYSGSNGSHFVRLLYLNSTDTDHQMLSLTPHILKLDGCTEFCPLKYFTEYTKHLIPDDWGKECKLPESYLQFEKEEIRLGVVFIAVVFLIVTVSFAVAVSKMYSNRRNKKTLLVSLPTS